MTALPAKSLLKMLGKNAQSNPKGGMADTKAALIDGQQPAALSEGEFVIPADVVALIGDGNSEAGLSTLDSLVAEIRQRKTGTEKQPNPMAQLFAGGKVKGKKVPAYKDGGAVSKVENALKSLLKKGVT